MQITYLPTKRQDLELFDSSHTPSRYALTTNQTGGQATCEIWFSCDLCPFNTKCPCRAAARCVCVCVCTPKTGLEKFQSNSSNILLSAAAAASELAGDKKYKIQMSRYIKAMQNVQHFIEYPTSIGQRSGDLNRDPR